MKILLLVVTIILTLSGCAHSNHVDTTMVSSQDVPTIDHQPTIASTFPAEPFMTIVPPTSTKVISLAEELEILFGDEDSLYNHALTCEYSSPNQVSLRCFFDGNILDSVQPTTEEWEALKDKPGFQKEFSFFRLPVSEMDQVLNEYYGISVEEVESSGFRGLEYLESTNCYYYMATGAIYLPDVKVTKAEEQNDGTIHMYYTALFTEEHIVVLVPTDTGYRTISNLPVSPAE